MKLPNNVALKDSSPGRGTNRLFVELPDIGWKLIGGCLAIRVPNEILHLSEFAGKTVRIAFANIGIKNGKPTALRRLTIEYWQINDDGIADQDDQMHLVVARAKDDLIEGKRIKATQVDIDAILRCLGLSRE
jgi:hypothetical protein